MSKLLNLAAILLLLVFNIGCSDDNKLDVILGADKSELSFLAKDEPQTVTLSCNTDWTAKSDKSWCRVSPGNGNGEGVLTVEVDENTGTEVLNAVITLLAGDKSVEIKVRQGTGGVYEIKLPDFTESFVYNVKNGDTKIAELCKESVPGGTAAVVTLYVMEEGGKYPASGYVVDNGGSIKYDGSGYTPGTEINTAESIFLVKGEVKTSAELAVPIAVEPELLADADENTYKITKIGGDYWMAENLKTTLFRDGIIPIDNITDRNTWRSTQKPAYCFYDNDEANKDIYGAIYNYYAVSNDRKLAPTGWHIPSAEEWEEMASFLGGDVQYAYIDNISAQLRAVSDLWISEESKPETNNVSGFSVLPGGSIKWNNEFDGKGSMTGFWALPRIDDVPEDFWQFSVWGMDQTVRDTYIYWQDGEASYVRCKKDTQK